MSTQRYIDTSFWDDAWVQELDPSEKLLYIYFLTNPLTNIAGVYKLTTRRICFDTGFNVDTIKHILDKFANAEKVFVCGEYFIIKNFPKNQKWETSSKIKEGIISILQDLPEDVFSCLDEVGYAFDLGLVKNTIISGKLRKNISGTVIKRVFEKYQNKCSLCGSQENLNIHHIKPLKEGGDNSFENLELLCQECHIKLHQPKSNINTNEEPCVPVYIQKTIPEEKNPQFLLEVYTLINNHNLNAKKKIPVSKDYFQFQCKEGRELAELCRQEKQEVIISALQNYLKVANSNTWKTGFSFSAFCRNYVEYTPEFFDMTRYVNLPKDKVKFIDDFLDRMIREKHIFREQTFLYHRKEWFAMGMPEGEELVALVNRWLEQDEADHVNYSIALENWENEDVYK